MSIRIFKSALMRQQLSQQELDDLAVDFLSYKEDGVLPDTFGRDAPMMMTAPILTASAPARIKTGGTTGRVPADG